ncbi:M20/M25/M40 family metallo-hydrolase [Halalkalibacter krulwichiae]|uniref:Succinyl-diaminopimelate desuccinylase n=1 Tax=Halalkalibacter krulwichiae TaxID=199441 RepID=A0A1X9MFW2_9BACI|nr:M20/M25/M40 family metallo-hydrolase [Halalkalibacter krulwichiae]ARK32338.1 succinyl-diaminopimelate desuccinylase [Halalkalibacter krulwichiae]
MEQLKWATPDQLRTLLCELVSWESRTFTEGECAFAYKVEEKLRELEYFNQHPQYLTLHDAGSGRNVVTALYKHQEAKETIVLISHFDTVQTEEYGDLEPYACQPEKLTARLHSRKNELPLDARTDLESGQYLFGRGTMDMKMGLALHMALLEKATVENWPINLLLATVPDEEVSSAGMRVCVKELVKMKETFDLSYVLFLNSEPSFSQKPGDEKRYIYTGTMGKIMPAALFYGKETHVGESLSGITANYIASYMTQLMEWNEAFREIDLGEATPLPVTLQQKDLQLQYSAQTPYRAAALYNVFLMKRSAADIMNVFEQVANEAANHCNKAYSELCKREHMQGVGSVKVLKYEELLVHAEKKYGEAFIANLKNEVEANIQWDEREKSIRLADKLMTQCQELAPAIILLFAPPYYPAVNSSTDPHIKKSVTLLQKVADTHQIEMNQIHYFNGICDLSYVNYQGTTQDWEVFERNTPVWGSCYSIPFEAMQELQAPVLNVGPFGKDAHKKTERLHIESAFIQTPVMLESLVKSLFQVVSA